MRLTEMLSKIHFCESSLAVINKFTQEFHVTILAHLDNKMYISLFSHSSFCNCMLDSGKLNTREKDSM